MTSLNGKPLVLHTIHAAIASNLFDRITVSTDDQNIKALCQTLADIDLIERPAELATDQADSASVVVHTLLTCSETHQTTFDEFVLLQPTSPLRTADHLIQLSQNLEGKTWESAISVCEVTPHPKSYFKGSANGLHKALPASSADIPLFWRPNGAIYWCKTESFQTFRRFDMAPCIPFVMSKNESADIDDLIDFLACEAYLGLKESTHEKN